ncbi:MAG: UvrD-helicase domain-containing protein [Methylobacillus sp.]|jgi:ATP-dependent exoDNAse (exonuclease V) beta subunit|nr:UvrD-helicase domain-containing protein [Methylobacillus sp.]
MTEPDLLQLDAAHRARALELASFIVEAPAGAGKTELLTQRYLKLLALVREPEEIVAITFTNKAAAEMRGRVLQSLQDARDAVPVTQPHKQVTRGLAAAALARSDASDWNLLEQPGRLRINTIDALCGMLARQMPLMSRLGAQPAVVENADAHYREAARRVIAMLEDEAGAGAVTESLRHFDNNVAQLAALLADMLKRRDQWLHHAGHTSEQQDVKTALRHLIEHDMRRAAEIFDARLQRQLMPVARYAAGNLGGDHALRDWETPLQITTEALPMWRALCDLLLTKEGELRKTVNVNNGFPPNEESKTRKSMLLEIIAEISDPQALARLRALPDLCDHDEEWRIVGNLARLLQLGAAHLTAVFQEAGEVDFVEISNRALQALEENESGPSELAMRLDYRIQHLLVDEFQDTSPAQVALLERLTQGWEPDDGRTLFCVGDPMQSIYRFRKADVGLFLHAAAAGIGHLALERLNLTRNNRSCPAVVDWVNTCFARVFPPHDSVTRGAISYRRFAATRAPMPGEGVLVHALVADNGTDADALAQLEAAHVADLIEQERRENPCCEIAVLVRARAHLEALVAEIRRNRPQLKFQAVEIEGLSGRQAVQDAVALTRAMLHRADRVHWLAVLRAPWCGLTLADLHALAADDHTSTIWRLMQDEERVARLSADGQRRLEHVRATLAESFAHQGRQSLRRWVESAWLRLAGAECLWDAGDARDVQAWFDLVEKQDGAGTLAPDQLEAALAELYAAPDAEADGHLQFMTLHKSKGLEFDTVILPGLNRLLKSDDSRLVLWEEVQIDGEPPQLVAAPLVPRHLRDDTKTPYDYLRGLENERSANESARVLYVGVTRAIRRLHLVGALCVGNKGEIKPANASMLALLWDATNEAFHRAAENPLTPETQTDGGDFTPQLIRLPRPELPRIFSEASPLSHAREKTEEVLPLPRAGEACPEPCRRGWGEGDDESSRKNTRNQQDSLPADCGTLAHLYMEMIANEGAESWSAERLQSLQPAMRVWLRQQGHAAAEADQGSAEVLRNLLMTLASEQGRWVLRARPDAQAEYALARAEAHGISTHVMDRTFVEDGERWIIDYKSARLDDSADFAQAAEQHRDQLERYAGLFAAEGLPIRKAVFFLAHGRLAEL